MAIYKDYGTPAEYSSSDRTAGTIGGIDQKGNVTMTRGEPQFRGALVPAARALRTKDTPTIWTIDGPGELILGNLNTLTGDLDEVENRFVITSEDGTSVAIVLMWDGTTLSVASNVGSTFEVGETPSTAATAAFSVDAEGTLSVDIGADVSGDFILSRIDGV